MYDLATRPLGPFGVAPTWPTWYARAVSREAGLRGGRLDEKSLSGSRIRLLKLVDNQAEYHQATARRFMRLHTRLNWVGLICFLTALVVTAGILVVRTFQLFPFTPWTAHFSTVASASLPALASASYGIRFIGDFEGAARRSSRMKEQFDALASSIRQGQTEFEWLRDRAHKASKILLGDVASWRLAAESREIAMPG